MCALVHRNSFLVAILVIHRGCSLLFSSVLWTFFRFWWTRRGWSARATGSLVKTRLLSVRQPTNHQFSMCTISRRILFREQSLRVGNYSCQSRAPLHTAGEYVVYGYRPHAAPSVSGGVSPQCDYSHDTCRSRITPWFCLVHCIFDVDCGRVRRALHRAHAATLHTARRYATVRGFLHPGRLFARRDPSDLPGSRAHTKLILSCTQCIPLSLPNLATIRSIYSSQFDSSSIRVTSRLFCRTLDWLKHA